jgi:hypothetical protein
VTSSFSCERLGRRVPRSGRRRIDAFLRRSALFSNDREEPLNGGVPDEPPARRGRGRLASLIGTPRNRPQRACISSCDCKASGLGGQRPNSSSWTSEISWAAFGANFRSTSLAEIVSPACEVLERRSRGTIVVWIPN